MIYIYICTYTYVRQRKITSYLEFKFYKQDNISHDTGQIFAVIFFSEKKQHIHEHYQYYCLQSPNGIVAHSIPFRMSGCYFQFVKF